MLNLEEIHNKELEPIEQYNYEIALKNYVLHSFLDDEIVICISKKYFAISFDFISKQDFEQEIIVLDETSFDALYNKFIKLRANQNISVADAHQEEILEDNDMNIAKFLKISSDAMTSEKSTPIIEFVNSLFYQAIKKKATDIHIEIHESRGEVRYRIDGILFKYIELDKEIITLIINRIKVISNLDIGKNKIAQNSQVTIEIPGRTLDVRVSVLPTFYGERVVVKILMQSEDVPSFENLGIQPDIITTLKNLTQQFSGMILVTGEVGSGKSTTLHSLLQHMQDSAKNIITLEDPIKYKSNKINQIQVDSNTGLTFTSGLKNILRQDPDVIMIGEMKDNKVADLSIKSALAGHLVLSTLDSNTTLEAILRLQEIGVEKSLISSSVLAILTQRLVRQLCSYCKEEDSSETYNLEELGLFDSLTTLYKSKGCSKCNNTGYSKRDIVAELFVLDDDVKKVLKTDFDNNTLFELVKSKGIGSIKNQLKQMCEDGKISIEEAIRIGIK